MILTGRWIYDPLRMIEPVYALNYVPVFNMQGRRNCIFWRGVPCFSIFPDFGFNPGELPVLAAYKDERRSCFWHREQIIEYIHYFYSEFGFFWRGLRKLPFSYYELEPESVLPRCIRFQDPGDLCEWNLAGKTIKDAIAELTGVSNA